MSRVSFSASKNVLWQAKQQAERNEEQQVKQALIAKFVQIYKQQNPSYWYWRGSSADFWEMVYLVYREVVLFDDNGIPLSLKTISKHFCELLHMRMSRNPSAKGSSACARKGVKQPHIVARYLHLFKQRGSIRALSSELQLQPSHF